MRVVRPDSYPTSLTAFPPDDPVVITGIGMLASVGADREAVWQAVQQGKSGVRSLVGLEGIPDGLLIGAPVEIDVPVRGQLKQVRMVLTAAGEALDDSGLNLAAENLDRFACGVSAQVGDTSCIGLNLGLREFDAHAVPWWQQWLPNTACTAVANQFGLCGPRLVHSTACASGLMEVLMATPSLRRGDCDIALVGSVEAIQPIFAAGFDRMKVLAHHEDPTQACRPYDVNRKGFVMGEGSAMFVLERLSHALDRGAKIYAQITGAKMLAEAFHVTGLDEESETLARLITLTLREARLAPDDVAYINAHGTGTQQNDVVETRGIRRAFGHAADSVCISSLKSMLGHLVNASGSVELAITALALRDGFTPPTLNLTDPDPDCNLDCIPLIGRSRRFDHALKLSVAFGGHLVAMTLRRWNDAATGFEYPSLAAA